MQTWAVLDSSGLVINTHLWDGVAPYTPPEGTTQVEIDQLSPMPGIGWTLSGSIWSPPAPPPPTPNFAAFADAVETSSVLNASEKAYMVGWLPGLELSLNAGDMTTITNGWAAIKAASELSSNSITTVIALAAASNIPGIS